MAFKLNGFQKLRVYDRVGVTLRAQDGEGTGCRDLSNNLKQSYCMSIYIKHRENNVIGPNKFRTCQACWMGRRGGGVLWTVILCCSTGLKLYNS